MILMKVRLVDMPEKIEGIMISYEASNFETWEEIENDYPDALFGLERMVD